MVERACMIMIGEDIPSNGTGNDLDVVWLIEKTGPEVLLVEGWRARSWSASYGFHACLLSWSHLPALVWGFDTVGFLRLENMLCRRGLCKNVT